MKKILKAVAGTAAGVGAAYLLLGEVVYEGVINIKLNNFIRSGGAFEDPKENEFWEKCTIAHEAADWYDSLGIGETIIWSSEIKRNTFAEVIFADEKTDKWAVIIHGYSRSPKSMAYYAKVYHEMGFNIVMPNMTGHGSDGSSYCSMGYYDRYVVIDWINYILGINKDARIVIHGVSMGSATAMMVTGEAIPENVVAAVADCGYTSCWEEYMGRVGPMFHLPALPVVSAANTISKLRGNFDFKEAAPIKAVVHSKTPTLFIHGEKDTFVPYEMMEPLYEACAAKDKKMLTVPNAFHAASAFFEPELYWNNVKEFVGKYL